MRIASFIVAIACLAWAGYRREWFELAWTASAILLLGIDGALSIWRGTVDSRNQLQGEKK